MADSVVESENRPPDKKGDEEDDGQGLSHTAVTQQASGESIEAKAGVIGKHSEKLGHRRVKGDVITYKKTPTNMLMASIQLGLEQSIGKITNKPKRDLLMNDLAEKEEVEFPPEGGMRTPAHDYGSFKFKTYASLAFRHFREQFHIKADDFLVSLCNEALRELSNPGASGSVFYLTNDDEFIIKTVQHKEATFLRHMLAGYYMNLIQNKRTLLPKFYGLYTFTNTFGSNIRICIMNNLLPSGIKYHEKYDLKGSTFGRAASEKELAKKSPTLKDLDFLRIHPEGFFLSLAKYNSVTESMKRDCTVLESFKIMDYSLLMGVHNIDEELRSRGLSTDITTGASPEHTLTERLSDDAIASRRQLFSVVQERGHEEVEALPYAIPDGGISARNAKGDRLVIFIGIIDILQSYRFRKKLEHSFKAILHEGDTVSVHRPGFYAQRFTDFFSKTVFHPKALVKRKSSSLRRPRQPSAPVSPSSMGDRQLDDSAATGQNKIKVAPSLHLELDTSSEFTMSRPSPTTNGTKQSAAQKSAPPAATTAEPQSGSSSAAENAAPSAADASAEVSVAPTTFTLGRSVDDGEAETSPTQEMAPGTVDATAETTAETAVPGPTASSHVAAEGNGAAADAGVDAVVISTDEVVPSVGDEVTVTSDAPTAEPATVGELSVNDVAVNVSESASPPAPGARTAAEDAPPAAEDMPAYADLV